MDWEQFVSVAAFLLQLLAGGGSTYLIDWLKTNLKLQGHWALVATAAVATVIAIASLVVEGALTAESVSWDNFVQVFILVIGAAHVRYNMLKGKETAQEVAKVKIVAAVAQEMAGEAMATAEGAAATTPAEEEFSLNPMPDKVVTTTWRPVKGDSGNPVR